MLFNLAVKGRGEWRVASGLIKRILGEKCWIIPGKKQASYWVLLSTGLRMVRDKSVPVWPPSGPKDSLWSRQAQGTIPGAL